MAGAWPALAVAALRFTIGSVFLSTLLLVKEGPRAFVPRSPLLQLARGGCMALASACFFTAIFLMPLAEAMAIAFVAPILTVILSGPMLGEKVRWPAWIASMVALGGVLLILRPNLTEIGWPAVLPVISAVFFALMVILNRKVAGQGSVLSMQVFGAAISAVLLVLFAFGANVSGIPELAFGWPSWGVIVRCMFVAATASTAHWLVFLGTARAGASQVAPAIYTQMLIAVLLGWWWFSDVPDWITIIGAGVIIASGLFLWRHSLAEEARQPNERN